MYDICTGIFFIQFLFQDPEYHKSYITGQEMGLYAVLFPQVDRPCPEVCLHDSKGFFDFPSFSVDLDDLGDTFILQVSTYGIESIILFFFMDQVFIKENIFMCAGFTIFRHLILPYEAVGVVLILWTLFISSAPDQLICPVDLSLPDFSLIVHVLRGKGYNQPLLKWFCAFTDLPSGQIFLDPSLFVENPVRIKLFIELIKVVFRLAIPRQLPAFCAERELL